MESTTIIIGRRMAQEFNYNDQIKSKLVKEGYKNMKTVGTLQIVDKTKPHYKLFIDRDYLTDFSSKLFINFLKRNNIEFKSKFTSESENKAYLEFSFNLSQYVKLEETGVLANDKILDFIK